MDQTKKHVKASPEEKANVFSKIFYWWYLPFYYFGYKNDIQLKDLYNASKTDLSEVWGDRLQTNWEKELKKDTPSLKRAIFRTFVRSYSLSGMGQFIQFNIMKMILPVVLAEYINYFDHSKDTDVKMGYFWATSVVVVSFLIVVCNHGSALSAQRVGMRTRVAVCSLMYRKLLKLDHKSLGQTATGQLVNLMSNDVQRFDLASLCLHFSWLMPINLVISFYIMYRSIGIVAAAAGMGAIILESIPIQGYMSKLQGKFRYQIAFKTDRRVKLMDEITSGIQVIKMYAWEKPFEKMVVLSRKLEINFIRKTSYIYGMLTSMSVFTERLSLYIAVITFVLIGKTITGDVIFSMAQLFNTVQLTLCIYFPRCLSYYAEASVSIGRIEKFLMLDEIDTVNRIKTISDGEVGEIELKGVSASWKADSIAPTLVDLTFRIKPGTLCCVVGNVGAGKSSILQLLLKELTVKSGVMTANGKIAFASQEPWLFVSSVRNNILFGKPYDRERYREVVRVCSLIKDFQQFPFRDKTLVGERGVSLSGGQRARVNLARAVYSEADIYLFDDPLSAVDTKVARHLFDECFKKYLSGKTRILVTHQLQFMKKADVIIIVNNGKIEKIGEFEQLSQNDLNIIQQEAEDAAKKELKKAEEKEKIEAEAVTKKLNIFQSDMSLTSKAGDDSEEKDELIEKGDIKTETYIAYWKAGAGWFFLLLTLLMFFVAQIASNASDLWLTHWTNMEKLRTDMFEDKITSGDREIFVINSTFDDDLPKIASQNATFVFLNETVNMILDATSLLDTEIKPRDYYMWIYTIFIFGSVFFLTLRSFLYYNICMKASKVLHNTMFSNVLQAPMRFFDTNASGRILSRFSKDMGVLDELLPRSLIDTIQVFMLMTGILIMVFIVTPWMIGPTIVLGIMFYWFRVVYLKTAQAVKRLEGTTRAPVFSHVSATLYGISTIRSASAQQMVTKEFDILQNQHTSTWFLFLVSSISFGFYLDVISTTFLALLAYQFVFFDNGESYSGNVGLVISQSLILTGMLQYGVRQSAEAASNMISVERIMQYTTLDREGPFETIGNKPPRDWPSKGRIVFKNTFLRYAKELPPVLKNLNISIESAEKIGIVGRTGAGKSTLIASLFRLAPIDGTISIDDVDTSKIGLTDLRSNISIIPQEPVLFSASLRYNLDPFEKHSDEVLWNALEYVELKTAFADLNITISEGGSNLSAGQRQLICLARAIVKNNKVLVMDEATANVDPQTDALIQKTIRERFKDCTVLTIAHRLNTIMDSDRVLVMDAGEAMEFDQPYVLLQNPESFFSNMLKETGPVMEETLKNVARETYLKKNNLPVENGIDKMKDV
ncbi:unnamed protein product [Phyllotreta striolata]|uniref:Uncharacterized protein n=1 Tax=Phyllotreta striolata TaxID=444603 RepID=A0A9N9XVB4_PHYSR|nr:unnamed protein product [Phyllotreta striolata]